MVAPSSTPAAMRAAARAFLDLTDDPRARAALASTEHRWLEYRPRPRPGVPLDALGPAARKAAHRLLATGLTPHAYAQAMAIVALEEVLDRQEGWRRGRHSLDFTVTVFGDPGTVHAPGERWGWRFEGHHLSVSMTLIGDEVYPTPVFLGANPHLTGYGDIPVLRPLAPEEDLARAVLSGLTGADRTRAVVAGTAPPDVYSGPRPTADLGRGGGVSAGTLATIAGLYLARIPEDIRPEVDPERLTFAWEGGTAPGEGHYYRLQGPDLLIEYDNTADGANHAHTVLRRPHSDFGGNDLAAHLRDVPHRTGA